MEGKKNSYRWATVKNSLPYAAIVTLSVYKNAANRNEIFEKYSGHGFTSQGSIESVILQGFDSWKTAAKHGLEYAFSLVDTFWNVDLEKIEGRAFLDTNPSIVGYTVMRAFFDKINYQLDSDQIAILEEFVFRSWTKPYKELIPNFFNLTFTEYSV